MNTNLFRTLLFAGLLWSQSAAVHAQPLVAVKPFTPIDSGQRLPNPIESVITLGDLDSDTDLDYYESRNGVDYIWLNDGKGHFTDSGKRIDDGTGSATAIALADLDGDHDLDLLVAKNAHNLVLFNDGQANFVNSGQMIKMATGFTDAIAIGDLDGDGDRDAYFGNRDFSNNPDEVWLNNGTGVFTDTLQRLGNETAANVILGDVDNDQDLDAIVTTCGQTNEPDKVWLNDGHATFTDSGQTFDSACTVGLAAHDLDGDQDLDLVIGNAGSDRGSLAVWRNNGAGQFSKTATLTSDIPLSTGDVDGDLDMDIVTADGSQLLNDGQGGFGQRVQTTATSSGLLHDLDGDGDLDLLVNTPTARQVWLNVEAHSRLPLIYR